MLSLGLLSECEDGQFRPNRILEDTQKNLLCTFAFAFTCAFATQLLLFKQTLTSMFCHLQPNRASTFD